MSIAKNGFKIAKSTSVLIGPLRDVPRIHKLSGSIKVFKARSQLYLFLAPTNNP